MSGRKAAEKRIDEGWDDWSEFAFIRLLLGADLNTTDLAASGSGETSFWGDLWVSGVPFNFYKTWILMRCRFEGFYFSATIWRTIDKGKIKILTLSSRGEINEPYLRRRRS